MYNLYISWITSISKVKIIKTNKLGILPFKNSPSDLGYNITIIKEINRTNTLIFFDTFVEIKVEFGYYITINPSLELSMNGYMFSHIINNENESVKIAIIKIDKSVSELKLPFLCGQIVLNKKVYYEIEN